MGILHDFGEQFARHRRTLIVSYIVSAVTFATVYSFAPRTSFLAYLSTAWLIAPGLMAVGSARPSDSPYVLFVGGVLVNGGVYAAVWVGVAGYLKRRRSRSE
jgi:hypothetical protein